MLAKRNKFRSSTVLNSHYLVIGFKIHNNSIFRYKSLSKLFWDAIDGRDFAECVKSIKSQKSTLGRVTSDTIHYTDLYEPIAGNNSCLI